MLTEYIVAVGEPIRHQAKVTRILPEAVEVAMLAGEACGSCRVKSKCGMGESRERLLIIETPEAAFFDVGEAVDVTTEQSMGIKAVYYAYIFPFLFVMAVLLILLQSGCGELTSGLAALGALGLYYVILYLLRDRIAKEITFKVSKAE